MSKPLVRILLFVLVWAGWVVASAVSPAPLPNQQGLPPELTLADQPPLTEQVKTLEQLAAWVKQSTPQAGLGEKIKSLFAGGERKAVLINLPQLPVVAPALAEKPTLIAVQGLFVPGTKPEVASFAGRDSSCVLSLGPAVLREGLPEDLAGLPVRAEGLAQVQPGSGLVTIQVAKLTPGGSLCYLRLGRAYELLGQYQAAVAAYLEGAALAQRERTASGAGYEFGVFGATQAAWLTYRQLGDEKTARNLYSRAWTLGTSSREATVTWVQEQDAQGEPTGFWKQDLVTQAIAPTLKALEEKGFWYKFVQGFVTLAGGNAGLGLLLLAVATRILVYPLTKKQMASARDMQRLQPMMKQLQEKYKGDKQKFQEEFWKLCREHGVNPLGGCLPMLVQMPLLYFVYMGVRAYIVNLDGQGFLWVHSLARPDIPLLIVYTLSQIAFGKVTQQQNPSAALDPQQRQQQQMMTYLMPVMFFFLFQGFPAAFMLYWLGTNLAYLAQQLWYNRTAPPLDQPLTPKQAGGGWLTKMMGAASRPSEEGAHSAAPSFEEKKAAAEGKMTSKADAEKRRKRKRWSRPKR